MPNVNSGVNGVIAASATLTNAQIKALPTTSGSGLFGFRIVADPADATTLIVPTLVTLSLRGSVGYTNVGTSVAIIAHAGFLDSPLSAYVGAGGLLVSPPGDALLPLTYFTGLNGQGNPIGFTSLTVGVGLVLYLDNTLGDFTGGNAANTLTVKTQYLAINLPV